MSAATMLAAPVASADQPKAGQAQETTTKTPSQRSAEMAKRMSKEATVVKLDKKQRLLTLQDEQGKQFTVHVPDTVKRLDEIKTGDRIKVDYYQSLALSLKKGEPGAQPSRTETKKIERGAGKLPSGEMARKVTASVEVLSVDSANHQVTVRTADGNTETIDVADPEMQAELDNIKPGDRIEAVYTETTAVSVMRETKMGKAEKKKQKKQQGAMREEKPAQPKTGG